MVRSLRNQVVVASLLSLSSIGAFHSPAAEVNSLLPQLGANHAQTNETTLSAANHGGLDGQLTIRVYDYARLPKGEYEPARGQAERILSQAGVPTRWLRCALAPAEAKDPGCEEVITPTDLVVRILPADMAVRVPVKGDVFGYAVPSRDSGFGTVVSVFHHRVAELITQKHRRAGGRLYSKAVVLGHILAHELGQVLLGPNSHSRSGIMVFPWGPKQLEGCLRGGLLFSKAEAATIQMEVRERQRARQIRTSARERIDEATSHRIVDAPPALTVNIYNHAQAPSVNPFRGHGRGRKDLPRCRYRDPLGAVRDRARADPPVSGLLNAGAREPGNENHSPLDGTPETLRLGGVRRGVDPQRRLVRPVRQRLHQGRGRHCGRR